MNRHIRHTILLTLAIVVMAACGGGGSDVPSPAPTPTPTPTPTNPTDPTPTPVPTPQPAEPQPVAIGFRADLSDAVATTRSAGDGVLDDDGLKAKGFGVYCWYTGGDNFTTPKASTTINMLMRNQKVEYVGTKWTYSPSKYWPLNPAEKLTFRAYAPYTDYIVTDDNGMPQLPVVLGTEVRDNVVYGTDYHNGSQHDPLWGTGKHDGTLDSHDAETDNEVYGKLYDNYTYNMSGSLLAADNRDGVIDWYFHHGMAMLVFFAKLEDNASASDDNVYITNIKIDPLYNQGLLDISSLATSSSKKPTWNVEDAGDMEVNLQGWNGTQSVDLVDEYDCEIIKDEKDGSGNITASGLRLLTNPGLLIIPRDYDKDHPLTITVSYKINKTDDVEYVVKTTIPAENTTQRFCGNTVYTLNLTVGSALVAEITSLNVAIRNWNEAFKDYEVYNW